MPVAGLMINEMCGVTKLLCLTASIVALRDICEASVKTWRYDSDIFNPANWIGGKPSDGCRGLIFPERFGVTTFVDTLYTEEIVFPNDGQVAINDGGFIELNENPKCIKMKQLDFHGLHDPDSWAGDFNEATPLLEKLPCGYDDVVFPKGPNSPILFDFGTLAVKSVRFWNDTKIDFGDLNDAIKRAVDEGDVIDRTGGEIFVEKSQCGLEDECVCQNYLLEAEIYRQYRKESKIAPCIGPVNVIGNLAPSCGATIVFETRDDFKMAVLKNKLDEMAAEVDVHASRVEPKKVQIVFADKGRYNGKSVEIARRFYDALLKTKDFYKVSDPVLEYSGSPANYGGKMSSLTALLLSMFFVATIMGGLYIFYYGPLRDWGATNRLRLLTNPRTRLTTTIFARYDRNNDENLILEGESIAGSVIDLSKSFENRAYGTVTPSTSTGTDTTSGDVKSEKTYENPLYDLKTTDVATKDSETSIEETTGGAIEDAVTTLD